MAPSSAPFSHNFWQSVYHYGVSGFFSKLLLQLVVEINENITIYLLKICFTEKLGAALHKNPALVVKLCWPRSVQLLWNILVV